VLDRTLAKKTLFYIDHWPQRTVFQHPTSRIAYRVRVPPAAHFVSSFALASEVWNPGKGDGVEFQVYITDQGKEYRAFSQTIDPKNVPSDRRWHRCEVDLAPWVGEIITLTLVTTPGPSGDARYDWAGWGEPRITQSVHYDFLRQFDQAQVDADDLRVHKAQMTIDGHARQILFQHPPSKVVYPQVEILDHSILQFGIGIDPQVWAYDVGDGIEFQIWIKDASDHYLKVYSQYQDPKHRPEDRCWLDAYVDLDRFAGQTVEVHLLTLPGPSGDEGYDWGGWSTPMLIAARTAESNEQAQ
jgi:hypothetical protein